MLNLWGRAYGSDCEGVHRRGFLKVGSLALSGLTLPGLMQARAKAAAAGHTVKDTSVVWLWLAGGPSHIETFDPKMDAPVEFRSAVGEVETALPGVRIGGLLPEMAKSAKRMAFIRSFAHGNSGHAGGTHYVMTGSDHPPADAGAPPIKPSFGSVVARLRGTNNPASGMPSYVRLSGVYADGPAWLGTTYAPFDTGGQARNNMNLSVNLDRVGDRRQLLTGLDRLNRDVDRSGLMTGLDKFEGQAFDLVLGKAKHAFDLQLEDPRVRDWYNSAGTSLGDQLLMARRLCEAGCGFVTLNYTNSYQAWDMHEKIVPQMQQACPPLDRAISVFLEDLAQRGLSEKILLVITGEFGRTPRINGVAGRDHWGPLCTLALAGGGLKMGQAIGESSAKAEVPKSSPIEPKHLMATIFHVLGIDPHVQILDQAGRPQYLLPDEAQPIAELV
ncbi:MAG TPA: DUF1501 domain-containing protein [Pirellulales bacterium]|jgi:hypothetical protein|nr:DUF1501 domain-containing protein [Pirellulales bacterium]